MKWGTFGTVHIATLVLAALMIIALYFALRKASRRVQTWVLGVLSFSGIAAIIFNLVMWDTPLEYLPLHLCSINAMLLPIVVFSRSRILGNLLLVWSLGALMALVLNYEMTDAELVSDVFFFYYFPHVMEFGIPLLLFKLGHVQKDYRCIGSTLGLSAAIYTGVHLANTAINAYCLTNNVCSPGGDLIHVNYMFSLEPTNPLTKLFYQVIPCEYWYMYMVFPIIAVYLLALYAPQLAAKFRARPTVSHA